MVRASDGAALGQLRLSTLRESLPMPLLGRLPEPPTSPIATVAVVGGGFAGLAAAYFLRGAGFKPVVYEASTLWGGRVRTRHDYLPGRTIEFGAELIGWNHALWLGFERLFDLGFSMLTSDDDFTQLGLASPLQVNGRVMDPWDAERIYEGLDSAAATLVAPARLVKPYRPWDSIGAAELDARSLADWKQGLGLPEPVAQAVEALYSNDNVVATEEQSYLGMLCQIAGGGGARFDEDTEVMRCASGNDSLAYALADALKANGVDVRREAAVTRLDVDDNGVRVTTAAGTEQADYAVLATPPPSWRHMSLPEGMDASRYSVSGGPAVKYFSPLRRRVWLDGGLSPMSVSDTIGETWEGTDNQIGGRDSAVELSLFAGGPCARRALDQPDARDWYTGELEQLYPGYTAALLADPAPALQSWPDEQWIGWGYSSPKPGEVTTKVKALSEPFRDRLAFAGEHTCPAFFGYMEGALESGLLAAGQLGALAGLWEAEAVRGALEAAADAGWSD